MFDENRDGMEGQENAVGANGAQMPESKQVRVVRASGDPRICGFCGSIRASRKGKWLVELEIESECQNIRRLASSLREITLQELFLPLSRNPVFIAAEKAKCHPSCLYPVALTKAIEVALTVALPKTVNICYEL